jgi:hypothetical protein
LRKSGRRERIAEPRSVWEYATERRSYRRRA